MKIYFSDQKNNFKKHLGDLKSKEVITYNKSKLSEKVSTIDLVSSISIREINLDFLFNYKIFPENIMSFKTQWENENREMKEGDTIVQQVFIPPIKAVSQKIIFGVRIKEIIDQENKKGYSYQTLEGHVEKGISTFTVEERENKLVFKIHTFSAPGNILTKLLGPIFSVPYQTFCTKAAMENVKRQINVKMKV